jgi:hypothetical protein
MKKKLELSSVRFEASYNELSEMIETRADMLDELIELKHKIDLPEVVLIAEVHLNEFLYYLSGSEYLQQIVVDMFLMAESKVVEELKRLGAEIWQKKAKDN